MSIKKESNSMNRAVFILSVLFFVALTSGCASLTYYPDLNVAMVNDTKQSGIIIDWTDKDSYYTFFDIYIFVDDIQRGSISAGEIKGYKLSNGNHIIIIKGLSKSITRQITVNNDRHYFKFSGREFRASYYPSDIAYDIIPVEAPVAVKPSDTRLLNTSITNSFNTISRNIPVNSKIAIVNIASNNNVDSSFIMEELTLAFVNSRQFTVVDRHTLNVIREEQNFQYSGEVSDEDVISIGRFTGANVVITGSVSGNGEMRRLRLRALDVQTAQILAMSAEKI
jgi:TolB-like protein